MVGSQNITYYMTTGIYGNRVFSFSCQLMNFPFLGAHLIAGSKLFSSTASSRYAVELS
jgi:hypothetical protein